jgi:hypothetical protein
MEPLRLPSGKVVMDGRVIHQPAMPVTRFTVPEIRFSALYTGVLIALGYQRG